MTDLNRMAVVGDVSGAFDGATPMNPLGQARNAFDGAEAALAEFRDAAAKADRSPHFTDAGKLAKKRETGELALNQLARIRERALRNAEQALAELQTGLGADPIGRDDLVGELRAQEVRRHILRLDPLQREIALGEAIRASDHATVAAFLTAPGVFMVLPTDKLNEARQRWAERQHPARAREAAQLGRAIEAPERMIAAAHQEIQAAAGLMDDTVKEMARTSKTTAAG